MSLQNNIKELIVPELEQMECELFDLVFEKQGNDYFLRIFIDNDNGVDLDLCVSVSEHLSPILDEADIIDHEYYLEVSSPGAERVLKTEKHINDAVGKYVYVKTYVPIEGMKEFEGDLRSFDGETLELEIMIKTRKVNVKIPYDKVALIRLAIKF